MSKHVVLMKFTEKGITNISQSPDRASAFRAVAEKAGVTIEMQLWTTGPYDAIMVLDSPDEAAATALVLGLGKTGDLSTCMCRAFDATEFESVLGKMP